MKVSFVVLSWNSKEFLIRCVESIKQLALPQDWSIEIILVDSASTMNVSILAKARDMCNIFIPLSENKGFTGGMNVGLQSATGDWLIALNSDTVLEKHFLTHISACISNCDADILSVTVLRWLHYDKLDHFTSEVISQGAALNLRASMSAWKKGDKSTLIGSDGSAQIFSRHAYSLLAVDQKLYDESYGSYGEDLDVMLRAYSRGLKVGFCDGAVMWHIGSASAASKGKIHIMNNISSKALENRWMTIVKMSGTVKVPIVMFSITEDIVRFRSPIKLAKLYIKIVQFKPNVRYKVEKISLRLSLLSRYRKTFDYTKGYENPHNI